MSDNADSIEEQILRLAKNPFRGKGPKGPRRVATPEGAAFYGQPIGTIITPDMIEAKRKENKGKGVSPSKGMLKTPSGGQSGGAGSSGGGQQEGSSSSQGEGGQSKTKAVNGAQTTPTAGNKHTQASYPAPGIDSTPPEWMEKEAAEKEAAASAEKKPMALGVSDPTIKGSRKFKVGDTQYTAPDGSRLIRSKNNPGMAIVITPDKEIHFFTAAGEIEADELTKNTFKKRFGDKVDKADTLYAEEDFEAEVTLDNMQVGQKLYDSEGKPVFSKTETGWQHDALGLPVEETDVKPYFDSGELSPQQAINEEDIDDFDWGDDEDVEISFGLMSDDEFKSYMDSVEDDEELYVVAEGAPKGYWTLKKDSGSGLFEIDNGTKSSVGQLAFVRKNIRTVKPKMEDVLEALDNPDGKSEDKPKDSIPAPAFDPAPAPTPDPKPEPTPEPSPSDAGGTPPKEPETPAASEEPLDPELQAVNDSFGEDVASMSDEDFSLFIESKGKVYFVDGDDVVEYEYIGDGQFVDTSDPGSFDDFVSTEDLSSLRKYLRAENPNALKPGDQATSAWAASAPAGSRVVSPDGVLVKTPDGRWASALDPAGSYTVDTDSVVQEPAKPGELLVGTKLDDSNLDDFYEKALPGTRATVVNDAGEKQYVMTLDETGLWISSNSNVPDSYDFPKPPPGKEGDYYISKVGNGKFDDTAPTEVGVGTNPTVQWMSNAPTGARIGRSKWGDGDSNPNNLSIFYAKAEDGLWYDENPDDIDDNLEGYTSDSFDNIVDKYLVVSDGKSSSSSDDNAPETQEVPAGSKAPKAWAYNAPEGSILEVADEEGVQEAVKTAKGWDVDGVPISDEEMEAAIVSDDKRVTVPSVTVPVPTKGDKKFKAGTVATLEDVLEAQPGTKFQYERLDGKLTDYVKVNDDWVLASGGSLVKMHHWESSIAKNKVTFTEDSFAKINTPTGPAVKDTDAPEPLESTDPVDQAVSAPDSTSMEQVFAELDEFDKDLNELAEMDSITDLSQLKDATQGAKVFRQGPEDSEPVEWAYRDSKGWMHSAANDPISADAIFNTAVYSNSGAKFYLDNNLPKTVDQAVKDVLKKDIVIGEGFPPFSKLEIEEAIEALKNHSHGSPIYGLKSLDDENGIKAYQHYVIDAAKVEFPKHPPKAAVIAFLSKHTDPSDEDGESPLGEALNPTISLGSNKPAKNQFGVTGGKYKASDIKKAIGIIEGYDGKLYKSQLNKAGNPLAELDFNTLVGKNKDKIQQKQDVVNHLKKELDAFLGDAEIETPTTSTDNGPSDTDENTLQTDPLTGEIGMWVAEYEDDKPNGAAWVAWAEDLPVGTRLRLEGNDEVWTKIDDDNWENNVDGDGPLNTDNLFDYGLSDDVPVLRFVPNKTVADLDPNAGVDDPALLSSDGVDQSPIGSVVELKLKNDGGVVNLERYSKDHWREVNGQTMINNGVVRKAAADKRVKFVSAPEPVQTQGEPEKVQSFDDLKNAQLGTQIYVESFPDAVYTKNDSGNWEWTDSFGNKNEWPDSSFSIDVQDGLVLYKSKPHGIPEQYIASPAVQSKDNESGALTDNGFHSYAPGKYSKGLERVDVFADGYGVKTKINTIKAAHSLTPAEVAKLDLGSWKYEGVPGGNLPASDAPPAPDKPAAKVPKKPTLTFDPKSVPDGTYYPGDPSNPDSPVWKVEDGEATQFDNDGSLTPVSKTKLKNAVLKGSLVNKFGNTAVVPDGHVGTVKLFGHDVDVQSLRQFRMAINDPDTNLDPYDAKTANFASTYGVHVHLQSLNAYANITVGSEVMPSLRGATALRNAIDGILGDPADYPFKDVESTSLDQFEWAAGTGKARFPAYAAEIFIDGPHFYNKKSAEINAYIDEIAKGFGDGKTIGQHRKGMTLDQRRAWLTAFSSGSFKAMYALEVAGAIKQGKSHSAGWKHPGYEGKPLTNKVDWAPLHVGEKSVEDDVPGNWTSTSDFSTVSSEEIDNYLIAAGMTNNEYLSQVEKVKWYRSHRTKSQWAVNAYSARALQRKLAGDQPFGPPAQWSDQVAPAKKYNSMFLTDKWPVSWSGAAVPASEYYDDYEQGNVKTQDFQDKDVPFSQLKSLYDESVAESPYAVPMQHKKEAVEKFFTGLKMEADAEANKPIYALDPTQNISGGQHPVYAVKDQFGNKYVFKPSPGNASDFKYRTKVEAVSNDIARTLGFKMSKTEVMEFNGKYGFMQSYVPNVGDMEGFDWKTAQTKQITQAAQEHLLDWMLDNDDNRGANTFIGPNGDLVSIDKGRSFVDYGSWEGLVPDSRMNSRSHVYYSDLYANIVKGNISKEDADKAYFAARQRALKIANTDDGKLLEQLHEATDDRTSWSVDYRIDGKKVPQTQQGFFDAFFDRKSRLPEDVEALWADVYKKAKLGDLPEPPKSLLGENQYSGLDDPQMHNTVMTVGSGGTSALLGGAGIDGGHAVAWAINSGDGSKDVHVQFALTNKKQAEVLDWFKSNSDPTLAGLPADDPTTFSDDKYAPLVGGAKTISHHAEDQNFNQQKIDAYEKVRTDIQKDLDFWDSGLTPDDEGFIKFPSGTKVGYGHLGQYKLMLQQYDSKFAIIDKAKADKVKVPEMIQQYAPTPLDKKHVVYTNSSNERLSLLTGNNGYLYVQTNGDVSIVSKSDGEAMIGAGGFQKWENSEISPSKIFKAKLLSSTHDRASSFDGVSGLTKTDQKYTGGMNGKEFEVELNSGVKIYFRNAGYTDTLRTQHGRVNIVVPNAKDENDVSVAMEEANQWIEDNFGIDMSPTDSTKAELIYWKEMYDIAAYQRNTSSGSPYAALQKELDAKISSMGSSKENFLDDFAGVATPAEQNEYFRELWGKHIGKTKVDDMIAQEKYLPEYEQIDMKNLDIKVQGHPQWYRFDLDIKSLEANNAMLASSAYQTDHVLQIVKSGAALSTEERMRVLGKYIPGVSSGQDQTKGGSNAIFARINPDTKKSSINFIYHPRAMLNTQGHSYGHDAYDSLASRSSINPDASKGWITNKTDIVGSSGPETNLRHHAALFGNLEIVIFDNAQMLNEAIQHLKSIGIEKIRGVPIEDRLVMRQNLAAAVAKLKKDWYK